jgi:ectoine hydroxylase-related dioxygenase (phytanoyl-CoA dioxygenase family)
LNGDLLEEAAWGVERYYAGDRDRPLALNVGTDWKPGDGEGVRCNDYLSLQIRELRTLVRHPLLAAMAARLVSSAEIRLFHDQLLYKPPDTATGSQTAIGWHTDKSYWASCTSANMLSAWVPLQDCTAEMGPIAVFDGSHRWPHGDGLCHFGRRDLSAVEAELQRLSFEGEPIQLALKLGQVSFHHCRTIHGSHPNRSSTVRIACAIHYQDADNRYRRAALEDGRVRRHISDLLCRKDADGYPDYSDPGVFPRLWPPDEPSE